MSSENSNCICFKFQLNMHEKTQLTGNEIYAKLTDGEEEWIRQQIILSHKEPQLVSVGRVFARLSRNSKPTRSYVKDSFLEYHSHHELLQVLVHCGCHI